VIVEERMMNNKSIEEEKQVDGEDKPG